MSKTQYIKTFVALFVLLQLLLLFSAFQQWPFQALFSPKLQAIVDTLHLGKTEQIALHDLVCLLCRYNIVQIYVTS